MDEPGKNILLKNDFRDKKDWSKYVDTSTEETTLKTITIQNIMEKQNWDQIDILKMDIEGAERFIFTGEHHDFLQKVKTIAIEIHDEFNIRNKIYDILKECGFTILNAGDITFGINQNLCK